MSILSERHWNLVVFDLEKNYKIILDSMEILGHKNKAELVVWLFFPRYLFLSSVVNIDFS